MSEVGVDHSELIVMLCTAPDGATARSLARGLVERRLAACVNAISGVKSVYRWQGKIEEDDEIQLVIKTQPTLFEEVVAWLADHHPYDTPEVIALPAGKVSEDYLKWAIGETS